MPVARGPQLTAWLLAGALALAGCGGGSSPAPGGHSRTTGRSRASHASPALRALTASSLGTLPAPVMDPAFAGLADGRIVLLGGITPAQTSTDGVLILNGGHASPAGTLPNAQHDAQAAALGTSVYVFGGGQFSEYDHILRYDPAGAGTSQAGSLPQAASDVAVASVGSTAYVVGGYNGTDFLDTILAWTPGGAPRVVGHLPAGLRYAAVTAAGNRLIIAGGTLASGPTDQILSFDPATGAVTSLGHLPVPLTHASAAFIDGRVVVVGGRRQLDGDQTSAILAIDPASGAVTTVGQLPQPLSDAAVAATGGRLVVAGGDDGNGAQASILALTPQS